VRVDAQSWVLLLMGAALIVYFVGYSRSPDANAQAAARAARGRGGSP
jgi:hypothetical protein